MEWYHWQAGGYAPDGMWVHRGFMAARPDRMHIALGLLLVLGIGFRLVQRDPGAGPAAEGPQRRGTDAPRRTARKTPPPPRARQRATDTVPRVRTEVTAPGSVPVERLRGVAGIDGQLARPRVDPSVASADELATLPGIGPALARRIVEDRQAHGNFASLEDLRRVRGIGEALSARLAPYVTFGENGRPSVVTSGAAGPVRIGARPSRRVARRPSSG
jgi:competence ComEA-like helix-hairpin-helix protein